MQFDSWKELKESNERSRKLARELDRRKEREEREKAESIKLRERLDAFSVEDDVCYINTEHSEVSYLFRGDGPGKAHIRFVEDTEPSLKVLTRLAKFFSINLEDADVSVWTTREGHCSRCMEESTVVELTFSYKP